MQLQSARAGANLFDQRGLHRGVSFSQKSKIHRPRIRCFEHAGQIPRARRASGCVGAGCGTGASADHCRDAVRERFVNLLRRNEMDVAVDAARGDDQIFARDYLRRCADNQFRINAIHRIGIAGLADFYDASVADSDVAFYDAPVIDDQCIGYHQIKDAFAARSAGALAHAVANDFSAAEGDLVTVDGKIFFHFYDQFGVGETDAVAFGGTVEVGVGAAFYVHFMFRWPRMIRSRRRILPVRPLFPRRVRSGRLVPAGMFRRMPRAASLSK